METSAVLALARAATSGKTPARGVLESREDAFAAIYEKRLWGKGESASGPGSHKDNALGAIQAVSEVLKSTGARALLDVGCGDLNWLPLALAASSAAAEALEVDAIDITPAACDRPPAGVSFRVHDIVSCVPSRAYDVVLCRQCLNHMQAADARAALSNIRASGSHWLLATTYAQGDNVRLPGAEAGVAYRQFNLSAPPFDLGPPERLFDDEYDAAERVRNPMTLGLWRLPSQMT